MEDAVRGPVRHKDADLTAGAAGATTILPQDGAAQDLVRRTGEDLAAAVNGDIM